MSIDKGLVTKEEALQKVNAFIEGSTVIDLPEYIELLRWQEKLTRLVLQERKQQQASILNGTHDKTRINPHRTR